MTSLNPGIRRRASLWVEPELSSAKLVSCGENDCRSVTVLSDGKGECCSVIPSGEMVEHDDKSCSVTVLLSCELERITDSERDWLTSELSDVSSINFTGVDVQGQIM